MSSTLVVSVKHDKEHPALIRLAIWFLMAVHVGLLAYSGVRHSPVFDEPAHLATGISMWQVGRMDQYSVNPPLVRMLSALPTLLLQPSMDWSNFDQPPVRRPEFAFGRDFVRINGPRTSLLMIGARWMCIPFSLLGAWFCHLWARQLFGEASGLIALTLWCVSPMILGHGALITADVPAAATSIAASYAFHRWLAVPSWQSAVFAGILLGIALVTKFTCLLLVPVFLCLWVIASVIQKSEGARRGGGAGFPGFPGIMLVALFVVNLCFGFDGTLRRVGDYEFYSPTLAGPLNRHQTSGNRFRATILEALPVPFPRDYVLGLDLQRKDLEAEHSAFLFGQRKAGGWWYYYLAGLSAKIPVGTLLLLLIAISRFLVQKSRLDMLEELQLLLPMGIVILACSLQTGLNSHIRYAMPVLPFLYVWLSRCAYRWGQQVAVLRVAVIVGVLAAAGSSLQTYPHSISYFNSFVGGPQNGRHCLSNSNLSWGQDFLYLRDWMETHPSARPLTLVTGFNGYDPQDLGLDVTVKNSLDDASGWLAVDVNLLTTDRGQQNADLGIIEDAVVDRIGYSLDILYTEARNPNEPLP